MSMKQIIAVCGVLSLALMLFIASALAMDAPIAEYDGSNTAIRVKPGERFAISLESNPTTGYKWHLPDIQEKNILALIGSKYYPSGARLIGAGGRERWVFRASGPGKVSLHFKYFRPWEKDPSAAKEAVFNVEVIDRKVK